ncbi:MAG: aminoacyl-tRNA hydrolase [Sedimentisphaerales bacterium]|nr:aminoacyl-tRNA hydrolase [Sedimentisphaerales bacterium]
MADMPDILPGVQIDAGELEYRASRSAGPGGQNVNKLNTRITIFFDVANCPALSEQQKKRILDKLAGRADKNGVIHVSSQVERSQKANKDRARERLVELLRQALYRRPPRKKTKPSRAAKQRRLDEKKHRSQIKQLRRGVEA